MPAHEAAWLTDNAVLWPCLGTDAHGEPLHGDPVNIKVKFFGNRYEGIDPKTVNMAVEITAVVKQDIPDQSLLWAGILVDWTGSGEVLEVVESNTSKDVKGRNTRRTVLLRRFRGVLPSAAP